VRQLLIQVPHGYGAEAIKIAKNCTGSNLVKFEAVSDQTDSDQAAIEVVIVHVPNPKVEKLLEDLEKLPNPKITLIPRGVITMQPPSTSVPEQVMDVQERSPIEVFLAGLQSVGSWRGFLGYAAVAGIVVWIGLYTNTIYLLVAAMLIAPFAGPAMNTAIATARGDWSLLQRTLVRYLAAIALTILVAVCLSLILRQEVTTDLMHSTSTVSAVAVLLPLAAGAAGALNLFQSERSSLVSGAAVGMLVAASLAPPAGLIGMAIAMSQWSMVTNGIFVLLLQLIGINLAAALVFRVYGLSAQGSRYQRGKSKIFPIVVAVTLAALAGLLTWQFSTSPELQRSSMTQRAIAEIQQVTRESSLVSLVEANVRFTPTDIEGQKTLLCLVYVQRHTGVTEPASEIGDRLTQTIQHRLLDEGFNVTPLVDVSVLEAPN
jgi:uncharacterized hydrophobic protein (TIGR00271 family)